MMNPTAAPTAAPAAPPSPSTFLSPRITAELDKSLDAIEDLLLLDGDVVRVEDDATASTSPSSSSAIGALAPTAAAASTMTTADDKTWLVVGDGARAATTAHDSKPPTPTTMTMTTKTAPTTTTTTTKTAPLPPTTYGCGNAVHMEVQENAKLPTFHRAVDRSNASWHMPAPRGRRPQLGARQRHNNIRRRPSPDGRGFGGGGGTLAGGGGGGTVAPMSPIPKLRGPVVGGGGGGEESSSEKTSLIDEIMRLDENDRNLSERFLDGDDRSGAALAYCASGTLPQLDVLEVPFQQQQQQQKCQHNGSGDRGTSAKAANSNDNSGGGVPPQRQRQIRPTTTASSLPLYKRREPLPIPTLKMRRPILPPNPSGADSNVMEAAAAAVAAAIAGCSSPASAATPTTGATEEQIAAALSVQPTAAATTTRVAAGVSVATATISQRTTTAGVPVPTGPPRNTPSARPPGPTAVVGARRPPAGPAPLPQWRPPVKPGTIPRPTGPPFIPPPRVVGVGGKLLHKQQPPYHHRPAGVPSSIARAAAQRSKFGFGGDHRVPGVPAPPPVRGRPPRRRQLSTGPTIAGGRGGKTTSLPAPPMIAGSAAATAAAAGKSTPVRRLTSPPPCDLYKPLGAAASAPPPSSSAAADASAPGESTKDDAPDVAYERKKQRAKDARIRLNEAIEELAVAIDLAGSQSKERYDYVTKVIGGVQVHASPTQGAPGGGGGGGPVTLQHPLARLMDETIQQASTAKKWDRPSFIGLSSTIIRSLNAQCEGLTREVAQLRSLARRNGVLPSPRVPGMPAPPPPLPAPADAMHARAHPPVDVNPNESCGTASLPCHPAAKKQKVENTVVAICPPNLNPPTPVRLHAPLPPLRPGSSAAPMVATQQQQHHHQNQNQRSCLLSTAIRNTIETPSLLKRVTSFLDPSSLLRCTRASKRWNDAHRNPESWLHLCIRRFGANAVRSWEDLDRDGEEEEPPAARARGGAATDYVALYRRMAERNVMPSRQPTTEGSSPLGGSTLDGLVGGWAALVDRSNGETSRSVLRRGSTASVPCQYGPMPVVELRLLVQNTGFAGGSIVVPAQEFCVDAGTRRKGEKFAEVGDADERFRRRVSLVESGGGGRPRPRVDAQQSESSLPTRHEMCRLYLYESAVISLHIHARGCSTTSKFRARSKNIQILVCIDGTTRPLVIPFLT